jgi:hypothetical protein
MDVVGALGYSGQHLVFFSHGLLAYVTGKCVCIVDVTVGPRELIWRHETGINKVITNTIAQKFAIIPAAPKAPIEIFSIQTMKVICSVENPTNGAIVDAAFSRNGDLLCAISDALDRNVIVFEVNSQQPLFVYPLTKNFTHVSFNPIDSNQIFMYGESGVCAGSIQDLLDVHVLKVIDMNYEAKNGASTVTFNEDEYHITCAEWLPNNKVVFGTVSGHLFEADLGSNKIRSVGAMLAEAQTGIQSHSVALLLTIDHLIVGTSDGFIYWLPLSALLHDQDSLTYSLISTASQLSPLKGCISALVVDPISQRLYVGSDTGVIFKFDVQVAPKQRANEDEDPQADEVVEVEEVAVSVVGERISTFQEGAVMSVCALSTPIIGTSTSKIAKKSTHLLAMLVTGSHFGRINFWKQPANEYEAVPSNTANVTVTGIRRSVPKPLKLLSVQDLYEFSAPCVIAPMPISVHDGTCALGVGTASGHLEVFKFDAIETDDDEDEAGENTSPADEVRCCKNDVILLRCETTYIVCSCRMECVCQFGRLRDTNYLRVHLLVSAALAIGKLRVLLIW